MTKTILKLITLALACSVLTATAATVTIPAGSTSAQIQALINASAVGDTIACPAGTYTITVALTFLSGRTYQASPGCILTGALNGPLVQLDSTSSNFKIDGFTFNGGGLTFPGGVVGGTITNNYFQNIVIAVPTNTYPTNGITAQSGFSGLISGNHFQNIYDAAHIAGWSDVVGAIWLWNPSNTQITNNVFDQIGQAIHVTVTSPYTAPLSNLTISGNVITRNARYNIEVQGTALNNITVSSNNISSLLPNINGQAGISMAVGGTGSKIINNSLQGPSLINATPHQSDAIEAEGSGFLIQGNVAGNFGVAQEVLWTDATWKSQNNTWCNMTYYPSPQNILYLDTNGQNPAVSTGNTYSSSCAGVVFPAVGASIAPAPAPTPAPTSTPTPQPQPAALTITCPVASIKVQSGSAFSIACTVQ